MKNPQWHSHLLLALLILAVVGCKSSPPEGVGFEATGQLNDTGLLRCAAEQAVEASCPQVGFPGQDAQFGRDARAQAGLLSKAGGGIGGFDWTRLSADGIPLVPQDIAWSDHGSEEQGSRWSCVMDHVTDLMWEVKESDASHPRYAGHTYTWWFASEDKNGGFVEQFQGANCGTVSCTTQSYLEWVNATELCGHADWRMPTVRELSSIAVLSQVIPAVDKRYFPNTLQPRFFTGESLARDPSLAWYVYFSDGSVSFTNKGDASHIRLVRGGQL